MQTYYWQERADFADIDFGGGLYHGRYFNYFDRARQNILREHGVSFGQLLSRNVALVVVEANIRYMRPVRFEDHVHIYSRMIAHTKKSVTFDQLIAASQQPNAEEMNFDEVADRVNRAVIKLVCVDLKSQRPINFPDELLYLAPSEP